MSRSATPRAFSGRLLCPAELLGAQGRARAWGNHWKSIPEPVRSPPKFSETFRSEHLCRYGQPKWRPARASFREMVRAAALCSPSAVWGWFCVAVGLPWVIFFREHHWFRRAGSIIFDMIQRRRLRPRAVDDCVQELLTTTPFVVGQRCVALPTPEHYPAAPSGATAAAACDIHRASRHFVNFHAVCASI